MAHYFRDIPNFNYVNRIPGSKISDYVEVKNLFKRGKIREDIFGNLAFFEKYKIIGDERPDNISYNFYGDETFDWVVLLSNNIINIQTEWPMPQRSFDKYIFEKYKLGSDSEEDTYNRIYNGIHHYETEQVTNSYGTILMPEGTIVDDPNFSITYYDDVLEIENTVTGITIPVTNYEYEIRIEDDKRNIFLLKPNFIGVILNDIQETYPYKPGSLQYVNPMLKRGDNIRLTQ
jgi:hypothetical protein